MMAFSSTPNTGSFSSALQSVASLSDIRCIITAAVRLATERHAAEQPEVPSDPASQQHHFLTNKGEQQASSSLCCTLGLQHLIFLVVCASLF